MQRPIFTKYAPIPHPNRKPSLRVILDHINTLGRVVSVLGLAVAAVLIFAASCRTVSWPFALLLIGAFVVVWYRLVFLDAKYETNGELIDMGYNEFSDPD